MSVRVTAVIPARMASSRFPGKPLARIGGIPMIEHVRRRAMIAGLDDVIVATCDREIADVVTASGGKAVMTSREHERCTSRVAEACATGIDGIVVIVQGDEPLVLPRVIDAVAQPFRTDPEIRCTNLLSPLASDADRRRPDIVKAACARGGDVLYFTRAPIPFFKETGDAPVYRQTGIMALSVELLRAFDKLPAGPLERVESVDMLRLLENGIPVRGVISEAPTLGVDRPEDVFAAERLLEEDAEQQRLFEQIRQGAGAGAAVSA